MSNLLVGFKLFVEKKAEAPDSYVSTIKKQLKVPKKLWFGMPITLSNVKLGGHLIRQPAAFYVTDFDSHTVTIKPIPYAALDKDGNGDDIDDELDLDTADNLGKKSITMTRDTFLKLMEPPNYQGADFAGASGGVQWKSQGNTLAGPTGGGGPPMGGM
jgi:hypothetical protein